MSIEGSCENRSNKKYNAFDMSEQYVFYFLYNIQEHIASQIGNCISGSSRDILNIVQDFVYQYFIFI